MAGPGESRLAAAVGAAGGLGMIGVGASRTPEWIRAEADGAAAVTNRFGIGLMAWALERDDTQLATVLELRPALVSISFGDVEPFVRRVKESGIPVATQVGNLDEAIRAGELDVDLIVARGSEAGGHGRNEVATMPLLQAILERVDVPVVAAGGISSAPGLAGVLAAGAVGAWVGTALLACPEANNTAAARHRLIAAADTGTAYGRVFDVVQHLAWPAQYGARGLRNRFFDRWHCRLGELAADSAAAEAFAAARLRPEDDDAYDVAYIYAGQGVGALTRERSVAEVLADFAEAGAPLGGYPGGLRGHSCGRHGS